MRSSAVQIKRKLGWWVWGVVLLVLVIYGFFIFWRMYSARVWDGKLRQTLAWVDGENEIRVLSYQEGDGAVVFLFPREGVVDVSRGYGTYEIRSLWGLAQQESDFRLVEESLTLLVGAPVFHWVKDESSCGDLVEAGCVVLAVRSWWRDSVASDMPMGDRVWLWWRLRFLRQDQIRIVDLSEGSWAKPLIAADGKQEVAFDADFVDARVSGLLNDRIIRDENLSVEVVNTTLYPGVASAFSRIVGGLGGHVIGVGNVTANLDRCLLRIKPGVGESATVKRMMFLWECDVDSLGAGESYDISVWLGERQALWLRK